MTTRGRQPVSTLTSDELRLASEDVGDGRRLSRLAAANIHCGGCLLKIERRLNELDEVDSVRASLSDHGVTVYWYEDRDPQLILDALNELGFPCRLKEGLTPEARHATTPLLRATAVAGFASGNIMMLSVGVWAGADAHTRELFHWLSALIALPALAYSGQVFFLSAWQALRNGRTNMDVPISIGILMAVGMSLFDTINGNVAVYFEASTMLVFFLLIGRTLDHWMRARARRLIDGLASLQPRGATLINDDGERHYRALSEVEPGQLIEVGAGDRIPVDGQIVSGTSDLDCSLISGESAARHVASGALLQAGTLNLTAPVLMRATASVGNSFLAEMLRLTSEAETGRGQQRRIADQAARLYAPFVHTAALASLIGWYLLGGDWHQAMTIAVAVLIITCPCALGLAVPMVQVVAARRLFEHGIVVKDGAALERLAKVDAVVFDKTGVLTEGELELVVDTAIPTEHLALAAAVASRSRHPHAQALVRARVRRDGDPNPASTIEPGDITEFPGCGMQATVNGRRVRLGRIDWALSSSQSRAHADGVVSPTGSVRSETVLTRDGQLLATFHFIDRLRPDARKAVADLRHTIDTIAILSGDNREVVARIAKDLDIPDWRAQLMPDDKSRAIGAMRQRPKTVLMVGDGLNDAPAMALADVSMAPGSAADIGRRAADLVFLRDQLGAVPTALQLAVRADRLVRQNFMLAIGYNVVALPLAMTGHVTPLLAALCMSGSSILVVANALRLTSMPIRGGSRRRIFRAITTRAESMALRHTS